MPSDLDRRVKSLFEIRLSNSHSALISPNGPEWGSAIASLNRSSMAGNGLLPALVFHNPEAGLPDIGTVYIGGALAFRAELKDQLFPSESPSLEFFPLTVEGKAWCLLNCLQLAGSIDPKRSEVVRGLNGEICFVLKVCVTDPHAHDWEVFTLHDSNRAQLFVTDAFRDRVEKLRLQGITFTPIGELA